MNPNFDPDIGKDTQWKPGQAPEGAGRKKNVFNYLKEEYELSQSDLNSIIDYISLYPFERYDELIDKIKKKDESIHGMPKIMAELILSYDKAKIDDIIKILKASGKATDKQEIKIPEGIRVIFKNDTE
jgi:hypothetical protein